MPINYIKKYISSAELEAIKNHIAEIEKYTSGEIRLCFLKTRAWIDRKLTPKELALKEFYRLGIQNTKDKTGVLLFILFTEKKFEIIADEGINNKISQDKWDLITNHLISNFKEGKYKDGIVKALDEIKDVLMNEFPRQSDDVDELSNDIVFK